MNRFQTQRPSTSSNTKKEIISQTNRPDPTRFNTSYNFNSKRNQFMGAKCLYFPSDATLAHSKSRENSSTRLNTTDNRPRSVNRPRETNNFDMYFKPKESLEKTSGYDASSTQMDLDCEEARETKQKNSLKCKDILNINGCYGRSTRAKVSDRTSNNYIDYNSSKARDNCPSLKDSDSSQYGSQGAHTDNVDQNKANTTLQFGRQPPMTYERLHSKLYKTATNTRRNSPFSAAKVNDNSLLVVESSSKDLNIENSKSKMKTGKALINSNLDFLKVQRCQSYRLGTRNLSNAGNTSAEIKTEGSQLLWSSKRESNILKPNTRANIVNIAETKQARSDKDDRKPPTQKAQPYPKASLLFNQLLASSNNTSSKPGATTKPASAALSKRNSTVNSLSFFSKATVDSRLNLENYRLDKVIGQGSYATVKLAIEKETHQKVAIKTYEKFKLHDSHRRENVKREIAILHSMDHPNVIKLHKSIDTVTQIHLIMEFHSQQSLHSYLKSKQGRKIPETDARKIFIQIMEGLNYIHQKNVAHRDMKLENLLLDSNLNVKIIDFGFSIENLRDKTMNIFCGTPSYMAPELASKKEYYGHLTDIWAAGILLYVMLAGYFPFRETNEKELFRKIIRGQYEFPSHFSEDAKTLIKKMLRMNPIGRPSAEEILQDKWLTGQSAHNTNLKNYLTSKIQQYKNIQGVQDSNENTEICA